MGREWSGTYRNDSNKRPGRSLNFKFFFVWALIRDGRLKEVGAYSFSHKIWGGQKRHFEK